jgi:ATP-dependent Clp protease ATP-binding subunit ClpX
MRSSKGNVGNTAGQSNARCSFCGKPREQVQRLIVGPGVTICEQCVGICHEIIAGVPRGPDATCQR